MVKKHITHDDYKNCLLNREEQMRKKNVVRSHLHDLYTEEVNKVALSAEDDKRVIMEDGIHTLAYGHYSLKTEGESTRGVWGRNIKYVTDFIFQSRCFQKIDQSMIAVSRVAAFVVLTESAPFQLLKCCGISMINMTFKWLKC